MSSLLEVIVEILILTILSGQVKGSVNSLELRLHNPDVPVISGRSSNQINLTATILHSGGNAECDPWELYMWISLTDGENDGNSISPMQVINGKEQYLQLQEGKPAIFEHLTYGANLRNITCDKVQFLCGRFLGLGSNARCSSAVNSCASIKCKAVLEIQGIDVFITTEHHDDLQDDGLNLNISIDYNQDTAVSISSTESLWNIMVWMSPYSNGSQPRWSNVEQVLSRYQSSQRFIAGQQFGFTDVMYGPSQQELEAILRNIEVAFICVRFRSSKVRLESKRGSIRTSCTQLPETLKPITTTSSTTLQTFSVPTSDVITTGKITTGETEPIYHIVTEDDTATDTRSPPHPSKPSSGIVAKIPDTDISIDTHLTSDLEILAKIGVNDVNVETVAKDLVALTKFGQPNITTSQLQAVSTTLQNIATIHHVSPQVVDLSLATVDNILELDNEMLHQDHPGSPSIMAKSLQQILNNLDLKHTGKEQHFAASKKNIGLLALALPHDDAHHGVTFNVKSASSDTTDVEMVDVDVDEKVRVDWRHDEFIVNGVNDTGLTFPNGLFQEASIMDVRANIIVYTTGKLFQGPPHVNQSVSKSCNNIKSNIIGAELLVNGNHVTQLNPGVKMVYSIKQRNDSWQPSCVFWDFTLGDWSDNGCQVVQDIGGQVMCSCDHLTNFAVLMSPAGGCHGDMYFLDVVSKLGCVISITALLLTFLTYIIYKNLMGRTPQLILVQWTLSLMCLYIVFLAGIDSSNNSTVCTVVAAMLHYFTLTSVFWMGAEAASLFMVFVKGARMIPRPQKFLSIAAVIAWGLPAVFVIIPFLFVRQTDYRHRDYCFLMQGAHFYYSLLLPIAVVLFINIIVFALVLNAITCRRPDMSTFSSLAKSQSNENARMVQQVLCIAALLGITWIFGFLSIGNAAPVFNALFSIFNTFQGLAVFLLFCVRRKEVRDAWRRSFCCSHKQTYHIGQYRLRSGTAGSRTHIYDVNGSGGYRSRSGTVSSKSDALAGVTSPFDKNLNDMH